MPNKNISQFPTNNNLSPDNLFLMWASGTTVNATLTGVTEYVLSKVNIEPSVANRWHIPSCTTITVNANSQNFIYGDLYIEGVLKLEADSQLVVLNGDIILSGGTISGDGTTLLVELPEINTYTTGARLVGNILYFDRVDENDAYYIDLTKFLFTGNTASTNIENIYVSNLRSVSELTIHGKIKQNGNTVSGTGNNVALGSNSTANGNTSFIYSTNSIVSGTRSVVLGGQNITGSTNDTVYVPNLNINTIPSTNNALSSILVRDSDGSIRLRDVSSLGSSINYSNVIFVDSINGNNSTGLAGRFDKPYQSISTALSVASTMGASSTNKVLIYVRRGNYSTAILQNNVDVFCEAGVVFTGSSYIGDGGAAIVSNFYGYASFLNKTGRSLFVQGASTITFEFDRIINTSGEMLRNDPSTGTSNVVVKGRYMYTNANGVGYSIAIRNSSNTVFHISEAIEAIHGVFDIRNFSGRLEVNAPRLILANGNIYGGNYKQVIICYSSTSQARTIINAKLVNNDTAYYGGISGMITNWSSSSGTIEVNGDIYAGNTVGIYGSGNSGDGKVVVNGNIFSNIQPIYVASNNSVYVKNGVVSNPTTTIYPLVRTIQNGILYLDNIRFYNAATDGDIIFKDSPSSSINVYNCIAQSEGLNGYFAKSSTAGDSIRIHNTRSNKPLDLTIVDLLSPSGLIVDANTITPKF